MARPLSTLGAQVRDAIDAARGGVVTWRLIANELDARAVINASAPGEVQLVKRQFEELVRSSYLIADGHVPGKTRPLMGYRTAASMQQHAREAGLQMTAATGVRRAQQREAVEQLLLAWA